MVAMKSILSILIMCLLACAPVRGQTNDLPPTPPAIIFANSTNSTFWVAEQVPFMLYYGTDTNGNAVLREPPEWMLKGEPKQTIIRLKFMHSLTDTNELLTVDFKTPAHCSFVGYEIIEE